MSVIIRLQGLPWSASAMNIRHFFSGLSIPAGGVHIIGGDGGDAFIAFSSDDDARMAMKMNMCPLNGTPVQLFLSSKSEMQSVIDAARSGNTAQSILGTGGMGAAVNMQQQQQQSQRPIKGNMGGSFSVDGQANFTGEAGTAQGGGFNPQQMARNDWQNFQMYGDRTVEQNMMQQKQATGQSGHNPNEMKNLGSNDEFNFGQFSKDPANMQPGMGMMNMNMNRPPHGAFNQMQGQMNIKPGNNVPNQMGMNQDQSGGDMPKHFDLNAAALNKGEGAVPDPVGSLRQFPNPLQGMEEIKRGQSIEMQSASNVPGSRGSFQGSMTGTPPLGVGQSQREGSQPSTNRLENSLLGEQSDARLETWQKGVGSETWQQAMRFPNSTQKANEDVGMDTQMSKDSRVASREDFPHGEGERVRVNRFSSSGERRSRFSDIKATDLLNRVSQDLTPFGPDKRMGSRFSDISSEQGQRYPVDRFQDGPRMRYGDNRSNQPDDALPSTRYPPDDDPMVESENSMGRFPTSDEKMGSRFPQGRDRPDDKKFGSDDRPFAPSERRPEDRRLPPDNQRFPGDRFGHGDKQDDRQFPADELSDRHFQGRFPDDRMGMRHRDRRMPDEYAGRSGENLYPDDLRFRERGDHSGQREGFDRSRRAMDNRFMNDPSLEGRSDFRGRDFDADRRFPPERRGFRGDDEGEFADDGMEDFSRQGGQGSRPPFGNPDGSKARAGLLETPGSESSLDRDHRFDGGADRRSGGQGNMQENAFDYGPGRGRPMGGMMSEDFDNRFPGQGGRGPMMEGGPGGRGPMMEGGPGGRGPMMEGGPGGRGPMMEGGPRGRGPMMEGGPDSRGPMMEGGPGGRGPMMEGGPGGRGPMMEGGPGGRGPMMEGGPGGRCPMMEGGPDSRGPMMEGGPGGRGPMMEGGPDGRGPMMEGGPGGRGPMMDGGPGGRGPMMEGGPRGRGPMMEGGPDGRGPMMEGGPGGRGPMMEGGPGGRGPMMEGGPGGRGPMMEGPGGRGPMMEGPGGRDPMMEGGPGGRGPMMEGPPGDRGMMDSGFGGGPMGREHMMEGGPGGRGPMMEGGPMMMDRPYRGRGEPFYGRGRGGPFGRGRGMDIDRRFDGRNMDIDNRPLGGPGGPRSGRGLLGDAPPDDREGHRLDIDRRSDASRREIEASRRDTENRTHRRSNERDRDRDRERRYDDRRGRDRDDRRSGDRDRYSSRYRYERDRTDRRRSRSRERERDRSSRDTDRESRHHRERNTSRDSSLKKDEILRPNTTSPKRSDVKISKTIVLKNMPTSISYKDVRRFLQPLEVPFDGLKVINDKEGKRIGEAYVNFQRTDDAVRAVRRNGEKMDGHIVSVQYCPEEDFRKAVDSFVPFLNMKKEGGVPPPKNASGENKLVRYIIQLKNLPLNVTRQDIVQFFKGLKLEHNGEAAYIEFDNLGIATGMGFVEFKTDIDYKKALTQDGNLMGTVAIRVFPGKEEEADVLKGKQEEMFQRAALRNVGGPGAVIAMQQRGPAPRPGIMGPRPNQPPGQQPRPNQPSGPQMRPNQPSGQQVRPDQVPGQQPRPNIIPGPFPRPNVMPGQPSQPNAPSGQPPRANIPSGQPLRPNISSGQSTRPDTPSSQPSRSGTTPGQVSNQQSQSSQSAVPAQAANQQEHSNQQSDAAQPSPISNNKVSKPSGDDNAQDQKSKLETQCVHIQGLPLLATPRDIREFFADCQIANRGINIAHDPQGKPLGEGFVEFKFPQDFEKGIKKDKTSFGRHIVAVKPIGKKQMMDRLDSSRQRDVPQQRQAQSPTRPVKNQLGPNSQGLSGNQNQPQGGLDQPGQAMNQDAPQGGTNNPGMKGGPNIKPLLPGGPPPGAANPPRGMLHSHGGPPSGGSKTIPPGVLSKNLFYVRCQNFPPDISIAEIMQFFQGFRPIGESIRLHYSSEGKPTGNAVVGFASPDEANRALQRLTMHMCRNNMVSLHPA